MQILVVDDEPAILRMLLRCFEGSPLKIIPVLNPADVFLMASRFDPAVIVSDYDLPGMNGIDFLKKAKEIWPDAPRILFSGLLDPDIRRRAVEVAGVFRVLGKPCTTLELREAVNAALSLNPESTTKRMPVWAMPTRLFGVGEQVRRTN